MPFRAETGLDERPQRLVLLQWSIPRLFQYNPHAPHWDTMHWGHAVSDDLVNWHQVETALYPNQEYENEGGCFSGSAVEVERELHLFYTAVSKRYGQAQAGAVSRDGFHFEKYPGNPIIPQSPFCGSGGRNADFRDPKVFWAFGKYCMVVGPATTVKARSCCTNRRI